jgi:MFS family permease
MDAADTGPARTALIGRGTGRAAVVLGAGTTVAGSLPVYLMGAIFVPMQADLQAPAWVLGVAVAAYWAAAAAVSLTSGRIVSVIGSRNATIVTLVAAGASLAGPALFLPHWGWLLGWAVLGGAANGLGHPASNALISSLVARRRTASALGIKQGAVPLAALLAGVSVPLIALAAGWAWAYVTAAGVVVLLLVVGLAMWMPPRPPVAARRAAHAPLPPTLVRPLLMLACATTLGSAAAGAVSAYSVTAAIDRGMPIAVAGLLLSGGSLLGALCRVVVGFVADRHGGRIALPLAAALLTAGGAGSLLLAVPHPVVFAVGVALALGPGWGWTGLTHYVVARIAGAATPSATGLVQVGSYLGSGAGPLAFGLVYAVGGGATAIWIMSAAFALVAAAIAVFLSRRRVVAD